MTDTERLKNLALLLTLATQEDLPEEVGQVKVNDVLLRGQEALET
jgi:hypothetical protein